ncbi:MAG: hypothetical protein EZS28_030035, partial [Streblomastix strix]
MDYPDGGFSIFRSEKMILAQFVLPWETAPSSVRELGISGTVHFVDKNAGLTAAKRNYTRQVKACGEARRALRFFHNELVDEKMEASDNEVEGADGVIQIQEYKMEELQAVFEELEQGLKLQKDNALQLAKHKTELIEMREVLTRCEKIFERTFKEANESVSSYQAEGHEKQD